MSTNGTSKDVTLEDYIASIANERKRTLAQMIADEATAEEFAEAGYLTVHVRDMHQQIQRDVEGVVIPCGACGIAPSEESTEAGEDTATTDEATTSGETEETDAPAETVEAPAETTEETEAPATEEAPVIEDKTQEVN